MAQIFSKIFLSGDDGNGAGHSITGTASTAMTPIHTGVTGPLPAFDEVYCWFANTATADRRIDFNLAGGVKWQSVIPPQEGLHLEIPGLPLNNGIALSCFATVADELIFTGYAHRATAT